MKRARHRRGRSSVSIGMVRSLLCLVPSAWTCSYRSFCSVPTLTHVLSIRRPPVCRDGKQNSRSMFAISARVEVPGSL
jgi:hypothetical protein